MSMNEAYNGKEDKLVFGYLSHLSEQTFIVAVGNDTTEFEEVGHL